MNTRQATERQVWRPFITRVAHDASGSLIVAAALLIATPITRRLRWLAYVVTSTTAGNHDRTGRSWARSSPRRRLRPGSRHPLRPRSSTRRLESLRIAVPAETRFAQALAAQAASGDERPLRFDIPAGPLRDVLAEIRAHLGRAASSSPTPPSPRSRRPACPASSRRSRRSRGRSKAPA